MEIKTRVKKLDFELPPPPAVTIDERTNAYIERLRAESEFAGPLNIKIDDFEGPLDLLLFLVKAAKINIEDIFVSKITDQYLALVATLDTSLEIEKISEFTLIASILIEIKTKSLLPKIATAAPDEDDAKRELIRRLEEYKIYKEAGEKMKPMETVGMYFKNPDPSVGDTMTILRDMTMEGLLTAMRKLFLKIESRPAAQSPRNITLDRFTVAEKMGHIRDIMLIQETVSFFELFDNDYTKSEIITTFQALLELLKMQNITARQDEIYGDIIIRRTELSGAL